MFLWVAYLALMISCVQDHSTHDHGDGSNKLQNIATEHSHSSGHHGSGEIAHDHSTLTHGQTDVSHDHENTEMTNTLHFTAIFVLLLTGTILALIMVVQKTGSSLTLRLTYYAVRRKIKRRRRLLLHTISTLGLRAPPVSA